MKQRPSFRTIILLAFASLTLVAGVPWRQQAAATDNLDDSLLLLAASKARQAALQPSVKSPNELQTLAAAYREVGAKLRNSSPALSQSLYVKANEYDGRANVLERRRARGGPLHQFGHLLGRVVGRTMDFVGHAAEIYVEGEIDKAVDRVANAPARAVQRRLNPLWRILGSKLGGGLTGFLREPIDRAIQRNVDRILYGRPHRSRPRATAPAPATAPDTLTPSSTNVGTLGGFQESDCAVPGVTFPSISIGDQVTEVYDGPSLICHASTEGAHGLPEIAHIGITAFKADKLEEFYEQGMGSIKVFVDSANEWNAIPDLPSEARYEIDFILNDDDGYVFMITTEANVQGCLLGKGHGEEMVRGKYLVSLLFESCELGDAAAYTAALEKLRTAALAAILRLESVR
jgi:hypothetical protein